MKWFVRYNRYKDGRKTAEGRDNQMIEANPCTICDKLSNVSVSYIEEMGVYQYYCLRCYNQTVSSAGLDVIPAYVLLIDNNRASRLFIIELTVTPTGKTLTAVEMGGTKLQIDIACDLDVDFIMMWEAIMNQLEQLLPMKYMSVMELDDYFIEDRTAADIRSDDYLVTINGKSCTWREAVGAIPENQALKVKIDFAAYIEDKVKV